MRRRCSRRCAASRTAGRGNEVRVLLQDAGRAAARACAAAGAGATPAERLPVPRSRRSGRPRLSRRPTSSTTPAAITSARLGHRFDGEADLHAPGRARQLRGAFMAGLGTFAPGQRIPRAGHLTVAPGTHAVRDAVLGNACGYNSGPFAPSAARRPDWSPAGSAACPHQELPDPIVDSLLKQFAQSSQLGANAAYIEDLYEQYLVAPDSVGPKWKAYFDGLKGREAGDVPHSRGDRPDGRRRPPCRARPARWRRPPAAAGDERERAVGKPDHRLPFARPPRRQPRSARAWPVKPEAPDLALGFHRLSESDLDAEFSTGGVAGQPRMKLRDLRRRCCKATYTGSIGAEFMHITDVEQRRWMQERLETAGGNYGRTPEQKARILERLTAAEGLERYLHTKYVGQKRFSLEGGDSLIPMLDVIIRRGGEHGVKRSRDRHGPPRPPQRAGQHARQAAAQVVRRVRRQVRTRRRSRAHRRREVPHGLLRRRRHRRAARCTWPSRSIPRTWKSSTRWSSARVRSRQMRRGDKERKTVLPMLMHGDAAFAGQGVVMELFQMSQARGFAVGGTRAHRHQQPGRLHHQRRRRRAFDAVLHRRGQDGRRAGAARERRRSGSGRVLRRAGATTSASASRKDVVVDLVCYRRHGHNEADEPAATQPLMYQKIRAHEDHARAVRRAPRRRRARSRPTSARRWSMRYRNKLDAGEVTTEAGRGQGRRVHRRLVASTSTGKLSDKVDTTVDAQDARQARRRRSTRSRTRSSCIRASRRSTKTAARWRPANSPGDWGFAENLAYATLLDRRLQAAPGRPGLRPRHVLPPPRDPARPEHRRVLPAAARTGRRTSRTSPSSTRCSARKR